MSNESALAPGNSAVAAKNIVVRREARPRRERDLRDADSDKGVESMVAQKSIPQSLHAFILLSSVPSSMVDATSP